MAGQLFGIGALLSAVFLLVALLSGYWVGSLAYRGTVGSMKRAAAGILALLALLALLAAVMAALMFRLYSYSWWYIWDKVLLFLPFVALPLVVAMMLTVPRLLDIIRFSGDPKEAANRTKRRAAAQPELVVPVQSLAFGAILFAFKYGFPLPPRFGKELLALGLVFLGASGLLVWRQSIRRRRIHRDDGTSAMRWIKRIGVYTSVCLLLAFTINVLIANTKTSALVPSGYSLNVQAEAAYGGGAARFSQAQTAKGWTGIFIRKAKNG